MRIINLTIAKKLEYAKAIDLIYKKEQQSTFRSYSDINNFCGLNIPLKRFKEQKRVLSNKCIEKIFWTVLAAIVKNRFIAESDRRKSFKKCRHRYRCC